jgi:predicted AAA+ superfamily ATPase
MIKTVYFPRYSEILLKEAIEDSPVILIHGPRQCGKTTLAKHIGEQLNYDYISFDDETQKNAVIADPIGFVKSLGEYVILDEVQHVPELFSAIKVSVDNNRKPGRFILTGSTNILLLPKLSDSLAGRMEIIRLRPLALAEVAGQKPKFISNLFDNNFGDALNKNHYKHLGESLADIIVTGGYPAAIARKKQRSRTRWYRDYITTIVQRDVQDLTKIHKLDILPRLLSMAAGQTAHLFNASDLASPFSVSRTTIREYLTLLEQVFLIEQLAPWFSNRLSRLIKTHKLHMADTGLACSLLGFNPQSLWENRESLGQLLETFVYQELRKYADWQETPVNFYHFRNKDKVEVDIILEQGTQLAGIEVKASATVRARDFKGLNKLKTACGNNFSAGVVFYDGERILPFGDKLFAVPISLLTPEPK